MAAPRPVRRLSFSTFRMNLALHFSLIAAAVTYVMWRNVGNDKIQSLVGSHGGLGVSGHGKRSKKELLLEEDSKGKRGSGAGYWRVDCQSASKGLFLGLLCLVGGIVVLIIFFVMKDTAEFAEEMFWIFTGAEVTLLALSLAACVAAFVQLRKLSNSVFRQPYDLDVLLSGVTSVGAYVYGIFSIIAAVAGGQWNVRSIVVIVQHGLLLLQVSMQGRNRNP